MCVSPWSAVDARKGSLDDFTRHPLAGDDLSPAGQHGRLEVRYPQVLPDHEQRRGVGTQCLGRHLKVLLTEEPIRAAVDVVESRGLFELVVLEHGGRAVGLFDDEREIEDANGAALDEVCNGFRYLPVELVSREAQHQVFDRSEIHRTSFQVAEPTNSTPTQRSITRAGWDECAQYSEQ